MTHIRNILASSSPSFNTANSFYKPPKHYVDCRQLLRKRIEHESDHTYKKQLTQKQKLKFKKLSFIDDNNKRLKINPSPDKYNDSYASIKRYKSQNTFITSPKIYEPTNKRLTWVEDIQKYEQKNKKPTVGRYNLMNKSDFSIKRKSISMQKLTAKGTKFNNLDDVQFVSAQIPGPGNHNPHKIITKLKVNPTSMKVILKKYAEQNKRNKKKLNQSNISSCSYSPVQDNTFDSISKKGRRPTSFMKTIQVDKRLGSTSQSTSPGPGSHNLLNKWGKQTFSREKLIGKLNLFSKTTNSFPSVCIYH